MIRVAVSFWWRIPGRIGSTRTRSTVIRLALCCLCTLGLLSVCATGVVTADSHAVNITTTYDDGETTTTLTENGSKRTGVSGTITVTATVNESANTSLDAARIRINGTEVHRTSLSGQSDSTSVSPSYQSGWNSIEVLITDSDGTVRSRTYDLFVDVTPPRLTMTQGSQFIEPTGGSLTVINGSRHWFNGSFVDISEVERFEITVLHNGTRERTVVAEGSGQKFSSRVDLRLGENTISYSSTDEYGNTRQGANTVILEDDGNPRLTVDPIPNETYNDTVTINGTASDDTYISAVNITVSTEGNESSVSSVVDNPDYINSTDPVSHRSESFAKQIELGPNTTSITVTAFDGDENKNTSERSVTKLKRKNQSPEITLSNRSVLNLANDELVLDGTVIDDREISEYVLEITALPSGETIGFDVTNPNQPTLPINDSYTVSPRARISITAIDNEGNQTTRTFIADQRNRSFVDETTGREFPVAGLPDQLTPETTPTPTSTATPEPTPEPESDIRVTNVTINRTSAAVNDTVMLNVTAENSGSGDGDIEIAVVLNGSTLSSSSMRVAAGASQTERIVHTLPESGELLVNGQQVTTVGSGNSGLFSFLPDFGGVFSGIGGVFSGLPNPLALWPSGLLGTVLGGLLGVTVIVYAILKSLAIYLGY